MLDSVLLPVYCHMGNDLGDAVVGDGRWSSKWMEIRYMTFEAVMIDNLLFFKRL